MNSEADVDVTRDMTTSAFLRVLRAGDTVWVITLLENSLESCGNEMPTGES